LGLPGKETLPDENFAQGLYPANTQVILLLVISARTVGDPSSEVKPALLACGNVQQGLQGFAFCQHYQWVFW
jgi:hypothetical protein